MEVSRQAVGRPRNRRVDQAIVRATQELLSERGYAGLTVDAVAERAGVGKAAIYRRYATKQELIFSVVVRGMGNDPPPDAGSLRADLRALSQHMAGQLSSAPSDVLTLLLADVYADSAVAEQFSDSYLARDRLSVTDALERAVSRGEITTMPDPAPVHALLMGPIFAWLLVLTEDPARLEALADTVSEAVAGLLLRSSPQVEAPPAGLDPADPPSAGGPGRSQPRDGVGRPGTRS